MNFFIKINYFLLIIIVGANINHQRASDGMTSLMVATIQKNNRMVSRLIAKGADIFLEDKKGNTAMDFLRKSHNQVRILVDVICCEIFLVVLYCILPLSPMRTHRRNLFLSVCLTHSLSLSLSLRLILVTLIYRMLQSRYLFYSTKQQSQHDN